MFFINRFILAPYLFFERKYWAYVIISVSTFVVMQALVTNFNITDFIYHNVWSDDVQSVVQEVKKQRPPRFHKGPQIIPKEFNLLILSIIIVSLDMGFNISVKWLVNERRQSDIESENMSVKLSNLQSQVSPHFFMNTLNNIHALVEIDPHKAQETIIELSNLMDYLLYETSDISNVTLDKELIFLNNYVNLMRLRYPERVKISLCSNGVDHKLQIPPLLFLNFIENSFKYGVDYSKDSLVEISLSNDNKHITMVSRNTNHSMIVKRERKGLGINNARKRLDLIYGDKYALDIEDKPDFYIVTLKVPIL